MTRKLTLIILLNLCFVCAAFAQTTEFTYQGRLTDGALPASANYDFQFALYDSLSGGTQAGSTLTKLAVPVASGIFTVSLDFGAQFPGAGRFLDISAKKTTDVTYTLLTPRQPITSSPYSVKSLNADNATNATNVSGGTVSGNGAGLTNLNGGNISSGTVTVNQLSPDLINGPQRNLALLSTRRWDLLKVQSDFAVGTVPIGVAFDGANIWVTNSGDNTVTKLRASDGACVGTCTFSVGTNPQAVVFDGANIWVANFGSNNVTKLRAGDGAPQGTFAVGFNPTGVEFDGANIWVTNRGNDNVIKLRASDGSPQGTFAVGSRPQGVVFDGANIWVANLLGTSVTKLRASDGALQGTFPVSGNPYGIVFDGANIWVSGACVGGGCGGGGSNNNAVAKLRASDGTNLGTFTVGFSPTGIAFDGTNIWVSAILQNTIGVPVFPNVVKLRISDGSNQGNFPVGSSPRGVVFDGTNIWVANNGVVTRLPSAFP